MKDICSRFKYSDTDGFLPRKFPSTVYSNEDASNNSTNSIALTNSPSREVLQQCLQKYHHEVAAEDKPLDVVIQNIQADLKPYSMLKLGGFSLGNRYTTLLGDVLLTSPNLRILDLGFNGIRDKGASVLAGALEKNMVLEQLYLSGNEIGIAGAEALAKALRRNTALLSLHLSGNNIGEDGTDAIARSLRMNSTLRSLDLGTNGIGPKGAQSLADMLRKNAEEGNDGLRELALAQNRLGADGLRYFTKSFVGVRSQAGSSFISSEVGNQVHLNAERSDRNRNLLSDVSQISLTTLEIGQNGISSDAAVEFIIALTQRPHNLLNLYMDNNPIGDAGAHAFGNLLKVNTVLRVLDVSYTQMSLVGLRELSIGLSCNSSLVGLLLDGNDWASTQFMTRPNGQRDTERLSSARAKSFAASCVIGAVNSNAMSVLRKLTGVSLSWATSSATESGSVHPLNAEANHITSDGGASPLNTLTKNEQILKYIQDTNRHNHANMSQDSPKESMKGRKRVRDSNNPGLKANKSRPDASPTVHSPSIKKSRSYLSITETDVDGEEHLQLNGDYAALNSQECPSSEEIEQEMKRIEVLPYDESRYQMLHQLFAQNHTRNEFATERAALLQYVVVCVSLYL